MENENINISENIRLLRSAKGVSQETVAQALGISMQAVSKWETGSSLPDIMMLPRLAEYYGVTIDGLFYGADEKEASACVMPSITAEAPSDIPDDDRLRIVQFLGRRCLGVDDWVDGCPIKLDLTPYTDNEFNIEMWGSANIMGDIGGWLKAGDSVSCGDVNGCVSAGDGVNCGTVNGSVNAGDGVACQTVNGPVNAGDGVACGDVAGSVNAGDSITCGDVTGAATAGGDIECGNIGMNVTAGGDIDCGDIKGSVEAEGDVDCGSVGGDVSAEGDVECGEVGGDVKADGDVRCGAVGGGISTGGTIEISSGGAEGEAGEDFGNRLERNIENSVRRAVEDAMKSFGDVFGGDGK